MTSRPCSLHNARMHSVSCYRAWAHKLFQYGSNACLFSGPVEVSPTAWREKCWPVMFKKSMQEEYATLDSALSWLMVHLSPVLFVQRAAEDDKKLCLPSVLQSSKKILTLQWHDYFLSALVCQGVRILCWPLLACCTQREMARCSHPAHAIVHFRPLKVILTVSSFYYLNVIRAVSVTWFILPEWVLCEVY